MLHSENECFLKFCTLGPHSSLDPVTTFMGLVSLALLEGFITSHLDYYRSASHICLASMSSPMHPPHYCHGIFLKCKFDCDPPTYNFSNALHSLMAKIQTPPPWLTSTFTSSSHPLLNLTSLHLYPKAHTKQNNLQGPQASRSLLMLFPLSGLPFLHVLLIPIHLQLRDHFLQEGFLHSLPTLQS